MTYKTLNISLLFLVFIITGCASAPAKLPTTAPPEKLANISVVFGQGGGVSGFLKDMLVRIGKSLDVDLRKVDGKEVESPEGANHREYWLSPGTHELEAVCTVIIDGYTVGYGKDVFTAELEPGQVYYLEDVTLKKVKEDFDGPDFTCKPMLTTTNDT